MNNQTNYSEQIVARSSDSRLMQIRYADPENDSPGAFFKVDQPKKMLIIFLSPDGKVLLKRRNVAGNQVLSGQWFDQNDDQKTMESALQSLTATLPARAILGLGGDSFILKALGDRSNITPKVMIAVASDECLSKAKGWERFSLRTLPEIVESAVDGSTFTALSMLLSAFALDLDFSRRDPVEMLGFAGEVSALRSDVAVRTQEDEGRLQQGRNRALDAINAARAAAL